MEKVNINEFAERCMQKMSFLCIRYDYVLSESDEKSKKRENEIIRKLTYTNISRQRIIELVLIAQDYTTHMFCRIAEVYIKKIFIENEKYNIPDYYDVDNCLQTEDIEQLLSQENRKELSLMYGKSGWSMYDYLETRKYIIENSMNIIRGVYFPTVENLTKAYSEYFGREWKYSGRSKDFFIIPLKEAIKSVEGYGYEIIYDETQLPPYERDNMYPKITYFNKQYNIEIDICFEGRDFQILAHKNKSRDYYLCAKASPEEYKKLERKMIDEVLKRVTK